MCQVRYVTAFRRPLAGLIDFPAASVPLLLPTPGTDGEIRYAGRLTRRRSAAASGEGRVSGSPSVLGGLVGAALDVPFSAATL